MPVSDEIKRYGAATAAELLEVAGLNVDRQTNLEVLCITCHDDQHRNGETP
ncbi:MAG: hypothetical protein GY929_09070 [Actinomycetia bacterium]|nr:hypothetical protein [Actinomycetes bacterium]